MGNDGDKNIEPEWLRSIPLRSEEIGFSADELIACKACRKPNPPNRSSCLYCGTKIEGAGVTKFDIESPESWENGYNIILTETSSANVDRVVVQLASLLGADRETAQAILAAGRGIPLARVKTESQAVGVSEKLASFGIKTMIVADISLQPTSPPTRLRSISFDGDTLKLELFNLRETRTIKSGEVALIVLGTILEGKTELVERRKRRGTKTVSEAETSSDQPVIDVYSATDPTGWRIPSSGFDFSCLGSDKSLLVAENMKTLTSKLVEFSPTVRIFDAYIRVRSMLESSWPSESRRDSLPVGMNRKEVSNVFTTSNTTQLTKYSRLQWRLYEKKV